MPTPSTIIAGGFVLIILALGIFYEFVRIPHEREAARSAVMIEIKDQQLRAQAKADEERRAAQDKIARIEADYVNRQTADALQIQALNEAISDVEKAPAGACPGGLPVELRNILDKVGTNNLAGDHPAVTPPAVRTPGRAAKRSPVERHNR